MICQRCGNQNDPQALFCMRCGLAILDTTKVLPSDNQQVVVPDASAANQGFESLQLSLRIRESILMMPMVYQSRIILGREQHSVTNTILEPGINLYPAAAKGLPMQLDKTPEFLDLTAFGAEEAGVSREHAVLRCEGDFITIKDLQSRNGSYLNRTQLIPGQQYQIKTGDLLIIGKLIIGIAFRSQAVS